MLKSPKAARVLRGFAIAGFCVAANLIPSTLIAEAGVVTRATLPSMTADTSVELDCAVIASPIGDNELPALKNVMADELQQQPADPESAHDGGPGPVRLGVTMLVGVLFVSGAGLIGVRWKRDQSLPLILVVAVVLFGILAAVLAPGALRTGNLSVAETADVVGLPVNVDRSFNPLEEERMYDLRATSAGSTV